MKRLSPSLRKKRRYVTIEVISLSPIESKDIKSAIWDAILRVFGEVGGAKIDPYLIDNEWKNNKGIIRCSNNASENLISAFAFIESIGKQNVILRSLGVTNTINRAKKFL